MYKKKYYPYLCGIAIMVSLMFLTACEDYLDVVPEGDIKTIESTFEKRLDAEYWLQTCYVFMTIYSAEELHNPAYLGADEYCGGDYVRKNEGEYAEALGIGDGLQGSNSPLCNVWHKNRYFAALRYCNIFLDNIMNVYDMSEDEKRLFRAEVQAVKAFYYFDLMRRYGPIILVNTNLDSNSEIEDMQQARRPISEVVDTIVSLCDQAIAVLPHRFEKSADRIAYFNKEAAATIKALTLLYAASPLFNGAQAFAKMKNKNGELLFPEYDRERWHRAAVAADEAIRIARQGDIDIYSGTLDRPNALLNTIGDIEYSWAGLRGQSWNNSEALMTIRNSWNGHESGSGIPFDKIRLIYDLQEYGTDSRGCLSVPMNMVEMFYTDHGLPIAEDKAWMPNKYQTSKESDERYRNVLPLNESVLNLHRHREPRFYACIAADRTMWYRRIDYSGYYDGILIKCRLGEWAGSKVRRIDETIPQGLTGYWVKKFFQPYTDINGYGWQMESAPLIPMRFTELLLASAEAWNEYLDQPDERVYGPLDQVRRRAGILPVRDAWTSYAKNPQKCRTQAGMREIIQQEWNIEFAFEGRRFWNLRRWMTAPQELNSPQYGWNILAADEAGFYCNFEGPIPVWKKRSFTAPRDYFFPIRAEEILVSGVVQNLGW